jgi:hypothetical protein
MDKPKHSVITGSDLALQAHVYPNLPKFPFKTVFAGSRQPCGLSLSQCVRRVVVNPFGLTMYLLPRCVSHASPWAQQAFTCCADPDDGSALFRRHVAFPSRQFLQVPDGLVVCPCRNVLERVVVNPFGLTMYLLPHCVSHASPRAQQAFTCCADPDDGSALFRRHVAFPSRQFLQVPDSLVVCPYRNVLGGL